LSLLPKEDKFDVRRMTQMSASNLEVAVR